MSDQVAMMNRSMAGDIAETIKRQSGIDLRMVTDPEPFLILERLRRRLKATKREYLLDLLDEAEQVLRAEQYIEWTDLIKEDVSVLGLGIGSVKKPVGLDDDDYQETI
jgi:hypothetical protein